MHVFIPTRQGAIIPILQMGNSKAKGFAQGRTRSLKQSRGLNLGHLLDLVSFPHPFRSVHRGCIPATLHTKHIALLCQGTVKQPSKQPAFAFLRKPLGALISLQPPSISDQIQTDFCTKKQLKITFST